MARLKNNAISIVDIFDAVKNSLPQSSAWPIPLLQGVQENDRSPERKIRQQYDISMDCWGLVNSIIGDRIHPERGLYEFLFQELNAESDGMMSECRMKKRKIRILGEYAPGPREITYYDMDLSVRPVVEIHERMHALHHLIPDASGKIWDSFAERHTFDIELLAQLFTYKFFEFCGWRDEMNAMLRLADNQGFAYNTFRFFVDLTPNQCLDLYWSVREHGRLLGFFDELIDLLAPLEQADRCGFRQRSKRSASRKEDRDHGTPVDGDPSPDSVTWTTESVLVSNKLPLHMFTFVPSNNAADVEACLADGRLRGRSNDAAWKCRPGDLGFLIRERKEFIAVIEIASAWNADSVDASQGFVTFRVVERWRPGLPFDSVQDFLHRKRFDRPVQILDDSHDVAIILASRRGMTTVLSRLAMAMRS